MPASQPDSQLSNKALWLVIALYCLSGFTSLGYEVLWSRMLSMQFGVSIFGVVLTVAAFMIGLGAGSLAGINLVRRVKNPLRSFALLEIGVAIYALLLPVMLQATGDTLARISSHLGLLQWYLLQGTFALCLLVIPAFAMGLGFALVLKVADRMSLGKLYGLNTAGGVAGALFPLWSLPVLGWTDSIRLVAVLGIAIGAAAWLLSKNSVSTSAQATDSRPPAAALLVYAGIGACSIMLEIGWVRLYGMIMLRTEYVLGVILAVFLLGIALGSLLLPRVRRLSVLLPFAVGSAVLLGLWLLPVASAWVEHSRFQSFFGAMWAEALMVGLFTLPVTLALGAWLPLLADRYGKSEQSGVWLYGANSLGGGIGAIAACIVAIPLFGTAAMVAFAGLTIAALGLIWVGGRWVWPAFAVLVLLAWPLRSMPPVHELLPEVEANSQDLSIYEDAVSLTHVVAHKDGQRILLSDLQRMDASSDPAAVEIQKDQARLALLLHPNPQNVLFLGLGTGISMAGSMPYPGLERKAVELSQGAILAAKSAFAPVNGNIGEHAEILRDDARHYLVSNRQRYDVIVGDLFHPDLAGMGSLLSVQQFARAKSHLSAEGVFVQWIALNQFDKASLAVVLRSFRRVFPDAQLYMDGMHLALVGPAQKLAAAAAMRANLQRLSADAQSAATGGEGVWTWLGRYWGPVPDSDGPVQDEWLPYIEYNLPRARYDGNVNLAELMQWLLQHRSRPDEAMAELGVDAADKALFGRSYVATELTVRGWIASIRGEASSAGKLNWLAYQANPQDRWIANALADNMMQSLSQARGHGLSDREALLRVLKVYPYHAAALRAMWHMERDAGNAQQAEWYHSRLRTLSPLDSEVSR